MPRQPRFYFPGAVLHAIQRGNDRMPVFTCPADCRFYLDCLRAASRKHGVAIHGYVLMTNHVHLLASPSHPQALPRMMQSVGRKYVGRFNALHARTGTLWEGRYKATLVDTEAYLLACLRYIELNPVRGGLVAEAADYRWSSHRANAFGRDDPIVQPHPAFVAIGRCDTERRDTYRRMFGSALPEDTVKAIRDATQFEWALGDAIFRSHIEAKTGRRPERLRVGRRRQDAVSKFVSDPN